MSIINSLPCDRIVQKAYFQRSLVHTISYTNFTIIAASGGDIIETAIELAPLDHDTSHSRKRVSCINITMWGYLK